MGGERLGAGTGAETSPADLAGNRPGAMARARALELRRQAPVRTWLCRLLGVRTEEGAFRIGAQGESAVAARLATLDGSRWRVIHSVPVGRDRSDIDHVVIGPPGVFTVNTKHHPGGLVWVGGPRVTVNGRSTWYVRNARFEAGRASRLLTAACGFPVPVRAVIAVVGARLVVRRQPGGADVVDARALAGWLCRLAPQLGPGAVAAVFESARRASTWCPPAR